MNKIIRVFLASPGDVEKERDEVKKIVQEINVLTGKYFDTVFQVINWEGMSPDMGRPQGIVNRNAKIEDVDLFLGILWVRFGSNPGINDFNAESGTQEEFEKAYASWSKKGTPRIKIFRSNKKINNKTDASQLAKVQKFFEEFRAEGKHPGLIKEYNSVKQFRSAVYNMLMEYALNYNKKHGYGLNTFPIMEDIPERRWTEKVSAIRKSSTTIKLMAHSGYSFLANSGSRYRLQIEENLKKGRDVRIIINMPWSYSGLFCAVADDANSGEKVLKDICNDGIARISIESIKNVIEQSNWYRIKVQNTITGYKSLHAQYGDHIQLRFYKYEIPASVLITEHCSFVEPYIMANRDARNIQGMNTFEVQIVKENDAWKNYNAYFDLIWNLSTQYSDHLEEVSLEKLASTFKIKN